MAPQPGTVYLVGAGPGDPGLMTARGLELIAGADAILHDRLTPPEALAGARRDADVRYVGKRSGARSVPQEETSALLVELARSGRSVVRLKGGDPFVFGRGGEEAQALAAAGIPFEVVPGVTAGLAAPAYAGIPATHRDHASAVALVTGHEDPGKDEATLDWDALARFPGTLVLYMGVSGLDRIAERLIAAGRGASEPAAVVERGTLPSQRTVTGELREIGARARQAEIRPPAVTLVGEVARLRQTLAWLEARPLFGRTVAVTRARAQAGELAARLRGLGAEVIEVPTIRIVPRPVTGELRETCERISDYSLVCLTSPNGADLLVAALRATGRDARALAGVAVAAIGPATARRLELQGITPDVLPRRALAEELVSELERTEVGGRRVLIARAADARDVLPDALRRRGADVDVIALYDTIAEPLSVDALAALDRADYVTFSSSSTVRNLVAATPERRAFPARARVVSIGPVTTRTAREQGLEVHAEAARHDIDGLVATLLADAREQGGGADGQRRAPA